MVARWDLWGLTSFKPKQERKEERPPRREAAPKPQPEPEETSELEDADEEWNGPIPSFLGAGFGS